MSMSEDDAIRRDIPVVLWCWSRPAHTYRVFQQIRKFQPKQLFVRSDGPRPGVPGDALRVNLVRKIFEREIDWNCQFYLLAPEKNVGMLPTSDSLIYTSRSGERVNHNDLDMYIGLEDDDLPSDSFFRFTTELLHKYYHDDNVFIVSGDNFQNGNWRGEGSYYFSYLSHCWGAGFWRRKWRAFGEQEKILRECFPQILAGKMPFPETVPQPVIEYYLRECKRVCYGDLKNVTSDFLRVLYAFLYKKLTILPNVNLVQNIGFGPDGVNCNSSPDNILSVKAEDIDFPLKHPTEIRPNTEADIHFYRNYLKLRV